METYIYITFFYISIDTHTRTRVYISSWIKMKSQKLDTFHGNENPLMPAAKLFCFPALWLLSWMLSCPAAALACWLPEEPAAPTGKRRVPGSRQPARPAASQLASALSRQAAWKPVLFLLNYLMDSCRIHMSCLISTLWWSSVPSGTKTKELQCFCSM